MRGRDREERDREKVRESISIAMDTRGISVATGYQTSNTRTLSNKPGLSCNFVDG